MGFLEEFEKARQGEKESKEGSEAMRNSTLLAVSTLLAEIKETFGTNPEAQGIKLNDALFPVTDSTGRYQAPGLKILFSPRQFIHAQPEGFAWGGFVVNLHFHGCMDNQSRTLMFVKQEGSDERVWAFFSKDPRTGTPSFQRWSMGTFEEILKSQVLGKVSVR
jgi:hypothetical protein